MSPETKLYLLGRPAAGAAGRAAARLRTLVRLRGGLQADRRAELAELGVEVRTEAGDVITASLPASALEPLAELPYVEYVEVSRPLHPEEDG